MLEIVAAVVPCEVTVCGEPLVQLVVGKPLGGQAAQPKPQTERRADRQDDQTCRAPPQWAALQGEGRDALAARGCQFWHGSIVYGSMWQGRKLSLPGLTASPRCTMGVGACPNPDWPRSSPNADARRRVTRNRRGWMSCCRQLWRERGQRGQGCR